MSRLFALIVAAVAVVPARAETLIASLSTARVAITSNYTGSSIVVFGAIEKDAQTVPRAGPYDIVVMVRGPRSSIVVRQKEPMGPIWLNREQQRFVDIPYYVAALSSRPIEQVATDQLRSRLKVGLRGVVYAPEVAVLRGNEAD
ncbi:MAG: TIGR02186 family protein, partial [Microvirga sp.]